MNIRAEPQHPSEGCSAATLADAVAIAAAVEEALANDFMKNQKGGQKSAFGQGPRQPEQKEEVQCTQDRNSRD